MNSLPLFFRIRDRKVVVLGEGEAAEAKRRLVIRAGGECVGEPEAHHAALGFVAMEDEKQAEAAAIRLRCKGLLVNVTDRPALCDFTVPSIVDRDPVLIAVGTGGASAGLAKVLRLRIERILPQRLGALARALGTARAAMKARWASPAQRRRVLDVALDAGGALDVLAEHDDDAVGRWLATDDAETASGTHRIDLRSHDPEDLTLRDARLLGSADVVAHDPQVPEAILVRARADAIRCGIGEEPDEGLVVVIHAAP
ncbi:precorrin-2 dehydrogenase/sirohydrochlorin ferrochelatase family protein [Croceicoccus naphthovorans]|uniref:precorrin-2 dehydrogenase n=1 Tax=Croceicoccus naphthovorans TaxID=1348774 RepID=A0A0G3XIY1_9SPHN|nr:bifunctional precorrin-2 dehydrogenase/sirohydrochlorin ferrochelatase [Croceicoccus naphthovorans]AKM10561.1 siroheme synthase [Croceicoccus naphthovorans]MBB3988767.1 uroporphyrin-III C-methyltransferase/precorrin-2 dehydrogenase/sirohydrochlorin ferrochelatase [Croceicoccus naphthovorans]